MRKKLAWTINLLNVVVSGILVAKNCSPLYGAVACGIAVLAILIADIPEALKEKEVYNDEF